MHTKCGSSIDIHEYSNSQIRDIWLESHQVDLAILNHILMYACTENNYILMNRLRIKTHKGLMR